MLHKHIFERALFGIRRGWLVWELHGGTYLRWVCWDFRLSWRFLPARRGHQFNVVIKYDGIITVLSYLVGVEFSRKNLAPHIKIVRACSHFGYGRQNFTSIVWLQTFMNLVQILSASWRGHSDHLPEAASGYLLGRLHRLLRQLRRWLKILFADVGNSPTTSLCLGLKSPFRVLIKWLESILRSFFFGLLSDEVFVELGLTWDLRNIVGLPRTWGILWLLWYVLRIYQVPGLVEYVAYYRFLCKLLVVHFNLLGGIIFRNGL